MKSVLQKYLFVTAFLFLASVPTWAQADCVVFGNVMATYTHRDGFGYVYISPTTSWNNVYYFWTNSDKILASAAALSSVGNFGLVYGDAPSCGGGSLNWGGAVLHLTNYY